MTRRRRKRNCNNKPDRDRLVFPIITLAVTLFYLLEVYPTQLFVGLLSTVFLVALIALWKALTERNRDYPEMSIDDMLPTEFEEFVGDLFRKMGYPATVTPPSKDSGADVIVERWRKGRTAVQVKQSKNRVTVKAVQEVVSSLRHYRSERGLVVTNSFYTRPAVKLARENGVELWDRNRLLQEVDLVNCKLKGKAGSYYRVRYLLLRVQMVIARLGRRIPAA